MNCTGTGSNKFLRTAEEDFFIGLGTANTSWTMTLNSETPSL